MVSPGAKVNDMAGILNGLTKLDLGSRPVLVNNTKVLGQQQASQKSESEVKKDTKASGIVEISDTEPVAGLPQFALQKGRQLELLARKVVKSSCNEDLSKDVSEFVRVMQSNSGRTLTRPAFQFLDMLYKQLDDPSVFVQPPK